MNRANSVCAVVAAALIGGGAGGALGAETIPVGVLATTTGATAAVASVYSQGVIDTLKYINSHGGIKGRTIEFNVVDYGYDVQQAIDTYRQWVRQRKPVVVQGWGTADAEALVGAVAADQVVFMSGSSSAHLTDPLGRSGRAEASPYNFFYGPSYSDACRGVVQWAAADWRQNAGATRSPFLRDLSRPRFVYMGDNHPYPNAPMSACTQYARELGFDVQPTIRYSLRPADFAAHCQTLKATGAQYVFLGNTAESNVALVRACAAAGVSAQFLTNIYGWDENAIREAGEDGNGMVWVVSAGTWNSNAPGMARVREISQAGDPSVTYRPVHYMRGVCSASIMAEGMKRAADMQGGITGANVKAALEQMRNFVPEGLNGVCLPSTWTPEDHRGSTVVPLYRSSFSGGQIEMREIETINLPLRPDWLAW